VLVLTLLQKAFKHNAAFKQKSLNSITVTQTAELQETDKQSNF